jgi:hypothetical protein
MWGLVAEHGSSEDNVKGFLVAPGAPFGMTNGRLIGTICRMTAAMILRYAQDDRKYGAHGVRTYKLQGRVAKINIAID